MTDYKDMHPDDYVASDVTASLQQMLDELKKRYKAPMFPWERPKTMFGYCNCSHCVEDRRDLFNNIHERNEQLNCPNHHDKQYCGKHYFFFHVWDNKCPMCLRGEPPATPPACKVPLSNPENPPEDTSERFINSMSQLKTLANCLVICDKHYLPIQICGCKQNG